jgi:heme exporter protein D
MIRSRQLLRPLLLVLLGALVAATSGCASYLSAQVTSFHQANGNRLAGRSFVITPTREQAESLEYRAYADLVRDALVRQGLVASTPADAALEVTIRYAIDGGRAVTYGYPTYGYAGYGPAWGWGPYYYPGGYVPYMWPSTYPMSYGVVGASYVQALLYRRELRVEITERRAAGDAGAGGRVFEGTVVSEGESASIAPVMPAMVRALFSDFPGPNGVSRLVQVQLGDALPAGAATAK